MNSKKRKERKETEGWLGTRSNVSKKLTIMLVSKQLLDLSPTATTD